MITETGRVVAVESDGLWVETASQSACGRCAARKGCGQSLLAQMDGHRTYIKAIYNGFAPGEFREGQLVTIGVHESAVLRGSLMVYSLPLLGLVSGATFGHWAQWPEGFVALAAATGMGLTALLINVLSRRVHNDVRYQPVVVQPLGDAMVVGEIANAAPGSRVP